MAHLFIGNQRVWDDLAAKSGYSSAVLAEQLKVSTRHLRRHFHRLFGKSTQRWLDEQRLNRAAALLSEYRCIKLVAHALHFKQPSHFSREFRLRYGVSPTQYLLSRDQEELQSFEHVLCMN